MSHIVIRHCDRCGSTIEAGGSILKVKAGELTRRFTEPLDLCGPCGLLLAQFLQQGHQKPAGAAHGPSVG
jgi:hypothetical protein